MKRIFVPTQSELDWQPLLAKPQLHWKKGASAMTLAVDWEGATDGIPSVVRKALEDSGDAELQQLRVLAAFPEYAVDLPGGSTASQTDLMVVARNDGGLVAIAVEGKVEEAAGPTVQQKRDEKSAGVDQRIAYLEALLGLKRTVSGHIRYQFLHRLASAVLTARDYHAGVAVMVIHSFSESSTGYSDFKAFCDEIGVHPEMNRALRVPGVSSPKTFIIWCGGDLGSTKVDVRHGSELNLFLGTRRLTDQRENHLTEFIAAALAMSPRFRSEYAELVFGPYARNAKWAPPRIASIETQVTYSNGRDIPDMVLTLADGHVVAIEHKIDAKEGDAKADVQPSQLRRYLGLENIHALAYFRATREEVDSDIASHPKYACPDSATMHFTWRDLYPLLERNGGWYFLWLAKAFNTMGYRPAVARLGKWESLDDRKNFAIFWNGTRRMAEEAFGWRTGTSSIVELYLDRSKSSIAEAVWINPEEFAVLRIRVTPRPGKLQEVAVAIQAAVASRQPPMDVETIPVVRAAGRVNVVEVTTSLANVLSGRLSEPADFDERLRAAIEPILISLHH